MLLSRLLLAMLIGGGVSAQSAGGGGAPTQAPAVEAARISLRVGDHAGYGRLVFDWPSPPAYSVERSGETHLVRLPRGADQAVASLRRLPRNVSALRVVPAGVEITLRPGARLRDFRMGARLVFDALDPPAEAASRAPAVPPMREARPRPAVAQPTASPPEIQAAATPPPTRDVLPAPPPVPAPPPLPAATAAPARMSTGWTLPFPPETGAAMLQRGEEWLIILDTAPDMPLPATPRPGMAYRALPAGALLTLSGGQASPLLRRAGGRWELDTAPAPEAAIERAPIFAVREGAGRLAMPVSGAHRVVPLQDPQSGLPMLVGTLRLDQSRVAMARHLVDLQLLETALGVAVIARSDALIMRAGGERFVLDAEGGGRLALGTMLSLAEQASAMLPETVTRSFDLPHGTPGELSARLRAQSGGLAEMAPLSRGGPRLAAAETLLALGQPQEAQAMVQLARQEDPLLASQGRAALLFGAAALAAGRLEEAALLDIEPVSQEAALWRGLYLALTGQGEQGAALLINGRAILRTYPEALQRNLLPRVAEALADARQLPAARALLDGGQIMPGLELARAILAERQGEGEAALAAYDAMMGGRDRRMRAEAMRRATELRLARGEIDAITAARNLEQTLFAWRNDADEIANRSRIAALRQEGGDALGALALLREAAALFPDRQAVLQPAIIRAFIGAMEQATPLNAVAMYDAHRELIPSGGDGTAALTMLAERLVALELPERAVALLNQVMARTSPGEARAAAGARLAMLHLRGRDAPRALAALAASHAAELAPALQRERALLEARARAAQGPGQGEASAFAALGPDGDEALAEFLAERRNFAGAAAALGRHLDRAVQGQSAPLQPGLVRALVRQAALLALAEDAPGLAGLRVARGPILAGSPGEAAFNLLTSDPVRGLADLPRLQRELELFRVLPARLDQLRMRSAMAR
ncbi:hypothetical protein [Rhodovarius sp.]|uniref:hypothetical protein n=1 Tax=Rhodovarius sp. TaxID=2972673 RepID=UPI0034A0E264